MPIQSINAAADRRPNREKDMKSVKFNPLTSLVVAAALAIGLAACGGGSSTTPEPVPPSEPTAEELRQQRVEEQMTLIASASQGLTTAVAGLDTDAPTPAQIAAVDAAISLLENALAGAVDLSPNQTADARSQLSEAQMTVATARTTHADALDLAARREAQMGVITAAQTSLETALDALMADDAASITAVNAAIMALQGAVDAAADLSDAEKMDAMSDLMDAEVSAADAELDMYTAAAMAEGASNEAVLAAYEGKLKAATRLVAALTANNGSAADIAAANQVIGSATTMIASLKEDIQDAKDAADNETRLANNAVSMKVEDALEAHTPAGGPAEFMTPATALAGDGDTNFGVSRTSGDTKFALTQTAADARKKPYTMSSAPSAGTGWMGKSFSASGTSGKRPFTEMARVYTDIKMAGDVAWTTAGLGADATLEVAAANGPVTITTTATAMVDASRFTGAVLPSAPPADGESTTKTIADGTPVRGTFYGVSGAFSCTGCTVTRNAKGKVSISAALTFTPTGAVPAGGRMAKYADPDVNYTYFGYWMKSTTQRDDTKTHMIETFAGGMGDVTNDGGTRDLELVTGTANYYGAAAGLYVKEDGAGDSLVVTNGTFTADAMLTARFGGNKIAVDDQFMISGTISDFMDGSTALGFADLTLEKADFGGTSHEAASVVPTFVGETNGGGTSGNWNGRFFGDVDSGDTTETTADPDHTDDYPSDVSGEFNGHFTNGHVAGAFGAEHDQ
jgi:hypothetical protein